MLICDHSILTYDVFRLPNGEDVVYNRLDSSDVANLSHLLYEGKYQELNRALDFFEPRGVIKTRIQFKFDKKDNIPHKYISSTWLIKNCMGISCPQSSSALAKHLFQTGIPSKFSTGEKIMILEILKKYTTGQILKIQNSHIYVSREMLSNYASIYYYTKK